MDYKNSLNIIFLLFLISYSILADGLQEGVVVNVISGDTFIHYGYADKKYRKYKLACVKADPIKTKKGKYQKKALEKYINGKKNLEGILRGYLDNATMLIDVIDSEKSKVYLTTINSELVKNKVLRKIKEYPQCWQ